MLRRIFLLALTLLIQALPVRVFSGSPSLLAERGLGGEVFSGAPILTLTANEVFSVLIEQILKRDAKPDQYLYYAAPVQPNSSAQFLYTTFTRKVIPAPAVAFELTQAHRTAILDAFDFGQVADATFTLVGQRPNARQVLVKLRAITLNGAQNGLVLLDMESGSVRRLPWMGSQPHWSPDGRTLAGTRLLNETTDTPRFEVIALDPETNQITSITGDQTGSACNPVWSPDGAWLAYDLVSPTYQSYVDCFWGRGVAAERFPTGADWVLLSKGLPDGVHLVGFIASAR